jgi:hypothetical protein
MVNIYLTSISGSGQHPGPMEVIDEVNAGYNVKLNTLYLRFGLSAVPSHRVVVFRTCVV